MRTVSHYNWYQAAGYIGVTEVEVIFCDKCGQEIPDSFQHYFSGYGYVARYCAACYPVEFDEQECEAEHPTMVWACIGHDPTEWGYGVYNGRELKNIIATVNRQLNGSWRWVINRGESYSGIEPSRVDAIKTATESIDRMNNRIVLISFYQIRSDLWAVYGHYDISYNDKLGTFSTKEEAVKFCFEYPVSLPVPVVQGQGERIGIMASKLAAE